MMLSLEIPAALERAARCIPLCGLVQRFLWKAQRYGRLLRLNPLQKPISASNAFHNNAMGYDAVILSGTVNRSRRREGGLGA